MDKWKDTCLPCTMLGSGPAPPSVGTGTGREGDDTLLRAGESGDDRTFAAFRTPNRNTSPWGESYQGSEKVFSPSSDFHPYFSSYPMLINEGEFQGSFRGDRKQDRVVKREAHGLIL